MTYTFIEITEEEFDNQYPLVTNHLNPYASWGFDDDAGCLFETYGEELPFVLNQDPNHLDADRWRRRQSIFTICYRIYAIALLIILRVNRTRL